MAIIDSQKDSRDGTFGGIRRLIKRVRSVEDFFKRKHDADAAIAKETAGAEPQQQQQQVLGLGSGTYQVPLHYPRYSKAEYEKMPEWQLDRLLSDYGLPVQGDLQAKRAYAISSFLFPDQL